MAHQRPEGHSGIGDHSTHTPLAGPSATTGLARFMYTDGAAPCDPTLWTHGDFTLESPRITRPAPRKCSYCAEPGLLSARFLQVTDIRPRGPLSFLHALHTHPADNRPQTSTPLTSRYVPRNGRSGISSTTTHISIHHVSSSPVSHTARRATVFHAINARSSRSSKVLKAVRPNYYSRAEPDRPLSSDARKSPVTLGGSEGDSSTHGELT